MATVYYGDVAKEFVPHYFELLSNDPHSLEPVYPDNAQLQINSGTHRVGPNAICAELAELTRPGHLTAQLGPEAIAAQPYDDKILVVATARSETDQYVFTFVLAINGDQNRFGVTHQLIHCMSK
jgi:hypothetical protein